MAQLRAEGNQPTVMAAATQPIKLADRRPTETTEQGSPTRRPVERPNRRLSFGSFGALAAGLVILLIAGIALIALNLTSNNPSASSGAIAVNSSTAPDATQDRAAGGAATTAATGATIAASATTAAMTSAAATTSQAQAAATATTFAAAAAAPVPTGNASSGSGASNASTTAAAATTVAAGTTAAMTTASATTAAAMTTAATSATTAASATTAVAASSNPGARANLLPLYRGASEIILPGNATGLKAFLTDQANRFAPDQTKRPQAGLQDSDISRYNGSGTKAPNAKADDVATFYTDEARKSGYTVESTIKLQDDNSLKVRWLYLSRGSQHLAVLIVETLQANNNPLQQDAALSAGETGIFFLTTP